MDSDKDISKRGGHLYAIVALHTSHNYDTLSTTKYMCIQVNVNVISQLWVVCNVYNYILVTSSFADGDTMSIYWLSIYKAWDMAVWQTRVGQGHSPTHPHNKRSLDRQNEKGHPHENRRTQKWENPEKQWRRNRARVSTPMKNAKSKDNCQKIKCKERVDAEVVWNF